MLDSDQNTEHPLLALSELSPGFNPLVSQDAALDLEWRQHHAAKLLEVRQILPLLDWVSFSS